MKYVKMFGKSIPLIAIVMAGILILGASASLVPYLSDTVTANFEVTPTMTMRVGVSLGKESWAGESYPEVDHTLDDWTTGTEPLEIPNIIGGDTITIYLMSQNLADVDIEGFEEAIVTNTDGVTIADFESVVFSVDSIYGDLGYGTEHNVVELGEGVGYVQIDDYKIRFGKPELSTWGGAFPTPETDVTKIVVTFKPAAYGTYTFTYQILTEVPST